MRSFLALGLAGLIVPFACVSSSEPDAAGSNPDGGDETALPNGGDGGTVEGGGEQAPPSTATTLTVTGAGKPLAGVTVVFHDATGAVLEAKTTDGNGVASSVAPSGAQVTALLGTALHPRLVTITNTEPGDMLRAIDPFGEGNAIVDVSLQALPASPPAGTNTYVASAGSCATTFSSAPTLLSMGASCVSGGKFPLLVVARDSASDPIGFTFQKGNALANAVDGGLTVSLTAPWSTATSSHTLSATNATAAAGSDFMLGYTEVADGVPMSSATYTTAQDAGPIAASFIGHDGFPDFVQSEVQKRVIAGGGISYSSYATRSAAATGGINFDLAQILPLITSAEITAVTKSRPTASWNVESSLAGSIGTFITIAWTGTDDAGTALDGTWTVVAPNNGTSLRVPDLPPAVSSWGPREGVLFVSPPTVIVVGGPMIADYNWLRGHASDLPATAVLLGAGSGPVIPPLPVDGSMKLTAFTRAVE